ncbi:DGF-1-like protein, putative [Bodo saltans]|uniref:DGF-1-like protein, putative n=1 Tax=Bodo saltans TaxID=75058 RepID=A0A0S4J598_BODSA|nr:DGF-1-like protein, putative [Bodo saltans]|eukprot:CUG83613.1 DGF-1-like protein, putative [Bodo saltans]
MVMLGMSPCSQPTSKQTLSNLRALGPLPIGIDGYAGVVVGNIVIASSVALLQCGVVYGLLVTKRASSALEACEIVRAPSMTIAAFYSFYQGTFYAASQLMARPGMDDEERSGGAVAFVFVFAAPLVTVWFCRSRLPRMCIAYDFKQSRLYHQLYSGPIAYVMLPRSRIEPIQQRRMFSTLISSYRSPHPLVPVLPIAIPFLLTLLALWSPVGSNQCTMFFSLALLIHVVVCAAMIALRPLHLRYDLPLLVCGIVINGALLLLSILGISDPHFDMRDATFGLVVAQVVVQIVKTLLRFWSNKLEDLLENVPTYMEWSIGYGHLIADIDKVLTLDAGAEADDVEMLAIGLLDAADDNESLELHLEEEAYEAHDVVVTEDLQDQQELPHTLELLPVIGGCDAADHAVGGDASEGLCDLTHALETLVRHDEEMRLRDELRLSAEEPAAPAHNRERLAEDATQSIGR